MLFQEIENNLGVEHVKKEGIFLYLSISQTNQCLFNIFIDFCLNIIEIRHYLQNNNKKYIFLLLVIKEDHHICLQKNLLMIFLI